MSEFEQKQNRTKISRLARPAKPDRTQPRSPETESQLLAPQQALGNQAMQRFAQSCPLALSGPSLCPTGGVCHTCPPKVQAKLEIGQPNDKYEQEANWVAEQVMRMPEPGIQLKPTRSFTSNSSGGSQNTEEEQVQTEIISESRIPIIQKKSEKKKEEGDLREVVEEVGWARCNPYKRKMEWRINYEKVPTCMWPCAEEHEKAHVKFMEPACSHVSTAINLAEERIKTAKKVPSDENLASAEKAAAVAVNSKDVYNNWVVTTCRFNENQAYQAGINKCKDKDVQNICAELGETNIYNEIMQQWEIFRDNPPDCPTLDGKKKKEEKGETLQRKEFSGQASKVIPNLESYIHSLKQDGQPLSESVRVFFESRFGYDFSRVRIHTDSQAGEVASDLNALAFTRGKDIYFSPGRYNSASIEGRRLIAHELVHTIQQGSSGSRLPTIHPPVERAHPLVPRVDERRDSSIIQTKKGKKEKNRKRMRGGGEQAVIFAHGYPGYNSYEEEIKAVERGMWFPSSPDFEQTARDTEKEENIRGAKNIQEFFGPLLNKKGKIRRIVFIGHGSSNGLGLSGRSGSGAAEETIDESNLPIWQISIDTHIKPRLLEDATIDIYSCYTAIGDTFMKSMAQLFDVCVRGFPESLNWCLGYDEKKGEITSRGRISDKPPTDKGEGTCYSKDWVKGANKLLPPEKICPS